VFVTLHLADDPYVAVTADEVTDLASLPRRFDSFAAECRVNFSVLAERFLPALERLHMSLDDIAARITQLERVGVEHSDRLAALEIVTRRKPRQKLK
jgi:hypothetical protein